MRTRISTALTIGALVLGLAGCGTRVEDNRIEAAGNNGPISSEAPAVGSVGTPDEVAAVPGTGVAPAGGVGVVPDAAPGAGPPAKAPGAVATPKPGAGASAAPGNVPVKVGTKACTQQLAPIIIGQVGVFSGLVGQSTGNTRLGMSVWAKAVNASGGIACHPIQLYQADDSSDPSKTASLAQDMIQSKKVVAFVGTNTPVTIAAFRSVVDRYKIPSIGGDLVTPDWFQDPLLIAQGGHPYASNLGGVKVMAKLNGKTKVGATSCVEATACAYYLQSVTDSAGLAKAGLTVVAKQTSSLTQTDFTSVCQNFKNAGAEVAAVGLDSASLSRFARSCASIGFNVPINSNSLAIASGLTSDENLNRVGLYAGAPVSPYMVNETPAENAFHAALGTYAPTQVPDSPTMTGWTSGKLFEAAINALGQTARTKPLTTELLMDGVYSLKKENLGGLVPPLTFTRGQPAPSVQCFWIYRLLDGKFTAPYGNKMQCL